MEKQSNAEAPSLSVEPCPHQLDDMAVRPATDATGDSWRGNRLSFCDNNKEVIAPSSQWRDTASISSGGWGALGTNGWVAGQSPTCNSNTSDHHSELDDHDLQALEHLGGLASLIEEEPAENGCVAPKSVSKEPHRVLLSDITNTPPRPSPLLVPPTHLPSPCLSAPSPTLLIPQPPTRPVLSDSELLLQPSPSSTPNSVLHTPNSVEQQLVYCHVLHSQRRQPADLSEMDIKRLVELQIQQRQPIRPPWYRSRPRRQAQQPILPPEGVDGPQGTGVFCPALPLE